MRTLLRGGRIYDGTGGEPYIGDVLIDGDRIAGVAERIDADADEVIDLSGRSAAPGFIDAHSHNDWFAIKKDPLPYFEPFIRQGITSFVTGNCGISAVGFDDDTNIDRMGGGLFGFRDTKGAYGTVDEYFNAVDGRMPCNIALIVGHCTARAAVGGLEDRELTPDEEEHMLRIMEDNLKQGAAGLSLGLMYDPGMYAKVPELRKVAELCARYDRPLTVHSRALSSISTSYRGILGRSHLLRAMDELEEMSKGLPLKLQYSHAIFMGRRSLKDKDEFVRIIHRMRDNGVDAMYDIYNQLRGLSVITVILPAWYQAMPAEKRNKKSTKLRLKILAAVATRLLGFGFSDMVVAYIGPGYERFEGKSVHQIAVEERKSDVDMYLELCELSRYHGRISLGPCTTPEIISEFEHDPLCLYMTDAWVEDCGIQKPAIYDCFPKFLRDSLRGTGDTMPNTIRRMTGATADRFRLQDRGYLREGCYADVTVFDENAMRNGVPDRQKAFGIDMVFINGRKVLDEGTLDEEILKTSGRAMRVL